MSNAAPGRYTMGAAVMKHHAARAVADLAAKCAHQDPIFCQKQFGGLKATVVWMCWVSMDVSQSTYSV